MGFIEFNTYEAGASDKNEMLEFLKPFLSVMFGFLLGLIPSWISRITERKDAKRVFKDQYKRILGDVKLQIQFVDSYLQEIENMNTITHSGLRVCLWNSFDLINSLNKLALIKGLRKEHRENTVNLIGDIFQAFSILDYQAKMLKKYYEEYQIETEELLHEYLKEYGEFHKVMISYSNSHPNPNTDTVYAGLFSEMNKVKKELTFNDIIKLKSTLHQYLSNSGNFPTSHSLTKPSIEFDSNAHRIIGKMEYKRELHIATVELINKTIKEQAKLLYEEEKEVLSN